MGRRGRALNVAIVVTGTGIAAALVVLLTGGGRQAPGVIGGEGSGTVTLEPILVDPRDPTLTDSRGSTAGPSTGPATGSAGGVGVRVGSVGGLFPGHRVELGVTYVNPYSFPIAIDTVSVTATGTDRCPTRNLTPTPQPSSTLRISSGSSVASTVEVGMRRTAPDACQGTRFAVSVDVTAVQL